MGTALKQSQQLQQKMEQLNQDAAGIDAKLQKAQDSFVARMNVELPRIMDNYIKTRAPQVERQAMKRCRTRAGSGEPRMPQVAREHVKTVNRMVVGRLRPALLLSAILQIHVEKLFSHEEFVAVDEFGFRAHAAINTVPAAQIL